MAQYSSKNQIAEYLNDITKQFENNNLSLYTTISISDFLHMSRSLVSLYLNEMVRNNQAIKISSRPVYYLSKAVLEKQHQVVLDQQEYISVHELRQKLEHNDLSDRDFEKVIGKDGSLYYAIQQIKSAIIYPGGLPILLVGESSTGKKYLGKVIFEYCINHTILKPNARLNYLKVMADQRELDYDALLFGLEDNEQESPGLIDILDNGIIYIEDVSYLSELIQEKLSEFISTGTFIRKNGRKRLRRHTRVILSSMKNDREQLSQTLALSCPVVCNIPSFVERSEDERKEFILKFFYEEQKHLDKDIHISEKLVHILVNQTFDNNLTELKKCIKSTCANAYAQATDKYLDVHLFHLPNYLITTMPESTEEEKCVPLKSINVRSSLHNILLLCNNILHLFIMFEGKDIDSKTFLKESKKNLKYYYDVIIFQENYDDDRVKQLEKFINNCLMMARSSTTISFPINFAHILSRMIIFQQNHNSELNVWEKKHYTEVTQFQNYLMQMEKESEQICRMLNSKINTNFGISLSIIQEVFILLNMYLYNLNTKMLDTIGVILCHGYSTASSIADAVNTLLDMQVFEAIDMPIHSSIAETAEKLNTFLQNNRHFKNIVLMVDMGSLEEIGKEIESFATIGIINNVSTLLALEIGNKIKQKKEINIILEEVSKQVQIHYQMISIAKKDKVILFTSDAGISIAEKLCRLFKDSLPKLVPVQMIAYDYESLSKNGNNDIIFSQYDVELLVKPMNLIVKGVRTVTLEEIISFENISMVNDVLQDYLTAEEIDEFNQSLLRNFSLQSVMENLTILNAQILLDYVSEATSALQYKLKRKFNSKTIVGINMHICFLIERLVTKKVVEEYRDIPGFMISNSEFIEIVNECFAPILEHYKVTLPVSEIAYLYEYIENDVNVKVGIDDF